MADKFLIQDSGRIKEREALVQSTGASDAGKIPALDTDGRLDESVMPPGIGADTKTMVASEALAAGNLVNVWNDTGTAKARKADATTVGKECWGFVLASVAQDGNAAVYWEGIITGLSGLTPGATQYLDIAAGGITETPPSASGNIVQIIGVALSATEISFEPAPGIELA